MIRTTRVLSILIAFSLVVVSCGVPRDGEPAMIALPDELIVGSNAVQPVLLPDATDFQLWMVGDDDTLTTVARVIPHTPQAVLQSLLLGTTPEERAQGITSAISRSTEASVALQELDKIAFVDLSAGSLRGIATSEQRLAFGQIVWSLTGLTTVETVQFSIENVPIAFPTDAGAATPGVGVTRDDYESLRAAPSIDFGANDDLDNSDTADPNTRAVTPTPTPEVDDIERTDVALWMIDVNNLLIRVVRTIELTEEAVLASLLLGPEIAERNIDIDTAIPLGAVAINIDLNEETATAFVDLAAGSLPEFENDRRLLAVAQFVYSLTGLFTIDQVIFSIDGEQIALPTERGVAPPGQPLTRADFISYAPELPPLPTPTPEPTP